jgi:amino acid permease
MVSMKHLNILLGISYVFVIAGITIAFFQMKVKDADTVDRIIFRATIGYFMAWLIVFNPFVSKMYWVYEEGQFMSVFLFIHTFLLSFSFNFSELYRGHRKKVKLHLL